MPISKTCYFCERFWLCIEVYNTNPSSKHCVHPDPYAQFIPNDEWKEIEQLEKENEELKHQLTDALMHPTGTNSTNIDTSFGGVVDLCPNETCRHREKTSCYFPNCLD